MWDRCVSQRGVAPKNSTMINKAHNSRRGGGPSSLLYIDKLETPSSLHSSSRAVAPTNPATRKIFCSFDCQPTPTISASITRRLGVNFTGIDIRWDRAGAATWRRFMATGSGGCGRGQTNKLTRRQYRAERPARVWVTVALRVGELVRSGRNAYCAATHGVFDVNEASQQLLYDRRAANHYTLQTKTALATLVS